MARAAATAETDDARAKALQAFIKKANRKDEGAVFTFDGRALDVEVVPTGALSLDYALGVGGLPKGRIIEIYGPESAGKTSLALSVGAQAIKQGGMVGYIDVEHAISPSHVQSMGIDLAYFALSQPSSGEEALQMCETMIKEGLFSVIVVDSVAALVTDQELKGEIGDTTVGAQARLMSAALRKLVSVAKDSNAVVIFINQLREKIGVMYGNPETTPGGKALKYYASVRLSVRAPSADTPKDPTDAKRNIGLHNKVTVVKNKVAPPQKVAEYNLIWGKGIDFAASVFDVALAMGVIKEASGYTYVDAQTGEPLARGKEKARAVLSDNPELAQQFAERVYVVMREERTGTPAVEDDPLLPDDAFDDVEDDALAGVA